MAYLGIENGQEIIFEFAEDRGKCQGNCKIKYNIIALKKGDIEKLTGRKLRHGSEPIKYTDEA